MKTLRQQEGWMYIENRHAPVPDEVMVASGYIPGAGRGIYESATYTYSHCNAIVVIEPKRTRERGYCRKCDQRVCDPCNLIKSKTFECLSVARLADELQEAAEKSIDVSSIIAPWEKARS